MDDYNKKDLEPNWVFPNDDDNNIVYNKEETSSKEVTSGKESDFFEKTIAHSEGTTDSKNVEINLYKPDINKDIFESETIKETIKNKSDEKNNKSTFKKLAMGVCIVTTVFTFGNYALSFLKNTEQNSAANIIASDNVNNYTENTSMANEAKADSFPIETKFIMVGDVSQVVKDVEDSVVSINMEIVSQSMFNRQFTHQGAGSGIIFKEDDEKIYIVTNNHVIEQAHTVSVSLDDNKQAYSKDTNSQAYASYVGSDKNSDLAVISVTKEALKEAGIDNYKAAVLGDSDKLEVGESVIAIGNALGDGKSATKGIVSAKNKNRNIEGNVLNLIQTDAAINEGNSGGALVNANSEVVGINTAKLASVGVEGMGYSIPINDAKVIINEILNNGSVVRPFIGISGGTIEPEYAQMFGLPPAGVIVSSVLENSPAHQAGLKAGDVIIGINQTKIENWENLAEIVSSSEIGEKLNFYIYGGGSEPKVLEVTIADENAKLNF